MPYGPFRLSEANSASVTVGGLPAAAAAFVLPMLQVGGATWLTGWEAAAMAAGNPTWHPVLLSPVLLLLAWSAALLQRWRVAMWAAVVATLLVTVGVAATQSGVFRLRPGIGWWMYLASATWTAVASHAAGRRAAVAPSVFTGPSPVPFPTGER